MAIRKTSKKIVQDIVPSEKRSIREINIEHEHEPITKVSRRKTVKTFEERIEDETEPEVEIITPNKKKKTIKETSNSTGGSFKYLISFVIIFISIATIGVALSLSYSKAVVTITPKVANFDINGTFTAKKSDKDTGTNDGELNYSVINLSDTLNQTVVASKGPIIQTKSKGTAILYNNYSPNAQTIVAGTRLSNSNGLIYRTSNTVSIPGKKTTPGAIAVSIVADQYGDKYNAKIDDYKGNDFKIIGYKGTDKYNGFYARLKTDLTGGFLGNKMIINPDTKNNAIKAMQALLKDSLINKLKENVPKDESLYDNSYVIEYENIEPIMKDDGNAEIALKGTIYGALFNTDNLIKYIAGREIKKFPSDTYIIDGDKALDFKISNLKDFSPKKGTSLIFTLKGHVTITGTFSENDLKNELKGIKLIESNAIFAKYPSIANAYALITPFWLRSFPNSIDKINIEYKH